jgi:hypothetical protein
MTERTTVRLPQELLDRAKRKASAEGRTLTSLIEAIADDRGAKKKRRLPRISKATGGLMPGIDISDSAALQQIYDLEYVERMKHFR